MIDVICRSRRQFVTTSFAMLNYIWLKGQIVEFSIAGTDSSSFAIFSDLQKPRVLGLLYGGAIGDALGGPIEFQQGPLVDKELPCTRGWSKERTVKPEDLKDWSDTLVMREYGELRPLAEPYGPWTDHAHAGTITDDTRHKIVLMRTIRKAISTKHWPITVDDFATAYCEFTPKQRVTPEAKIAELNEIGYREYRFAARWLLGDRDPNSAKPVERLWSGVDNCSGQMALPPLAAVFSGEPNAAYLSAYAIDFVDSPTARDMTAGLVAGLAATLGNDVDSASIEDRWRVLLQTMHATDPYNLTDVPYVGRPLSHWLNKAFEFAERAAGKPAELFRLLETEGHPVYWWDAHFTLLVPISILIFCNYEPLAAMQLTLDFRHDSDSYTQVLGCMIGAVHGVDIFPIAMREQLDARLKADYGESISDWFEVVNACRHQKDKGHLIVESQP